MARKLSQILISGEDLTTDREIMRGVLASMSKEDVDFNTDMMMTQDLWVRRYVPAAPEILIPMPITIPDEGFHDDLYLALAILSDETDYALRLQRCVDPDLTGDRRREVSADVKIMREWGGHCGDISHMPKDVQMRKAEVYFPEHLAAARALIPTLDTIGEPAEWRLKNWGFTGNPSEIKMTTHPHGVLFEMFDIDGSAEPWARKLIEKLEDDFPGHLSLLVAILTENETPKVISTRRDGGDLSVIEFNNPDMSVISEIMDMRHPTRDRSSDVGL